MISISTISEIDRFNHYASNLFGFQGTRISRFTEITISSIRGLSSPVRTVRYSPNKYLSDTSP